MGKRGNLMVRLAPSIDGASTQAPDPLKGGDVYKWAVDQTALIRAGRYADIDWINVADEIESVGKSEFRSLKSLIEIIVVHMLKWDHKPTKRSRSRINSIDESRDHVSECLSDNPSVKTRKDEAIENAYRLGRRGRQNTMRRFFLKPVLTIGMRS